MRELLTPEQAHERMLEDLEAARKEFLAIKRTAEGQIGSRPYRYAPLEEILRALLPSLSLHGFTVVQGVSDGAMHTILMHLGGGQLQSSIPFVLPPDATPQTLGSALTYARRYGLCTLLCVAAEEDDDAATVSRPAPPQTFMVPDPRTNPPADAGDAPDCKECGKIMKYQEGISKKGNAYRGWFCPTGNHDPVWIPEAKTVRNEPVMLEAEPGEQIPFEG